MASEVATYHTVASLYAFSEVARDEILRNFGETSAGRKVKYEAHGDHFTIQCPREDDTALSVFIDLVKKFIHDESSAKLEMFEDAKITRMKDTQTIAITDSGSDEVKAPDIKTDDDEHLIEHETTTLIWTPSQTGLNAGSRFSASLLGTIGSLSTCRVEYAADCVDIVIKGDTERDVQKAASKLKIVDEAIVQQMSFPLIYSFPILEGEVSNMLRMMALKDLDDRRQNTTLLQSDSPLFTTVRGSLVIVLIKDGEAVQVKQSPRLGMESQLWKDYPHKSFGMKTSSPLQDLMMPDNLDDVPEKGNGGPITKWLEDRLTAPVSNAFLPDTTVAEKLEEDVDIAYKQPLEPSSPPKKPSTKRARAAKGSREPPKAVLAKPEPVSVYTSFKENANSNSVSQQLGLKIEDKKIPSTGDNQVPVVPAHRCQPPTIQPPYMPSAPSVSSVSSCISNSSPAGWGAQVIRGGKAGNLIDLTPSDKLQDGGRIRSRDVKRTMTQRKSSTPGFIGGNNAVVKSFEDASHEILSLAQYRQGSIKFVVAIGRLLINHQTGSTEFKKRVFTLSEWGSAFPVKNTFNKIQTCFSEMLTTRTSDAESILNIKLSQGRRLFDEHPHARKITYNFFCATKTNEQVWIEADEEGPFQVRGSEMLVGALDWHFPKRSFDARLSLTTYEKPAGKIQQQAKSIVENLKISPSLDRRSMNLSTRTVDMDLQIKSILLRRETSHRATIYPDLLLHLTEVQDLGVCQSTEAENYYYGSIQTPAEMVNANRLWWEASISSTNAATILRDNEELELGEVAMWQPDTIISKGIIRDLSSIAKEIVTRIDHVGFYNKGVKAESGSRTTRTSEKAKDAASGLRGIW